MGFQLGLIGAGIDGSRTPFMHEQEALAQGINLSYKILNTDRIEASLEELIHWGRTLLFDGFNITHPFKQDVIALLDHVDEAAAKIGAVNTVKFDANGLATGYNTDYSGYMAGLKSLEGADLSTVVQIGAGGAGSAVAQALVDSGVQDLRILDLSPERAASLAEQVGGSAITPEELEGAIAQASGLVNCTPIGMDSHPGTPVDTGLLRPDLWVSDVIYFPLETQLLRDAKAKGCATLDGSRMAVGQAVHAFEIFTGQSADPERMLEAFRLAGQR